MDPEKTIEALLNKILEMQRRDQEKTGRSESAGGQLSQPLSSEWMKALALDLNQQAEKIKALQRALDDRTGRPAPVESSLAAGAKRSPDQASRDTMAGMDVEKTIQSILTALDRLADAHTVLAADQLQIHADQQQMHQNMRRMEHIQIALLEGQLRQQEAQQRSDQKMAELREDVKQLTGNMNALIRVVDDLIRRDGRRS